MKRLGVFLLPLDGMLVHCRVTPSIKFARQSAVFPPGWREALGVKCLAQEHNTMSRQDSNFGGKCTDREAGHVSTDYGIT